MRFFFLYWIPRIKLNQVNSKNKCFHPLIYWTTVLQRGYCEWVSRLQVPTVNSRSPRFIAFKRQKGHKMEAVKSTILVTKSETGSILSKFKGESFSFYSNCMHLPPPFFLVYLTKSISYCINANMKQDWKCFINTSN